MFKKLVLLVQLILAAITPLSTSADEHESAQILVFGGTGRLGSDVVKALYARGHEVTVFTRESSSRERLQGLEVDFVVGDVLDAESIDSAINGRHFDVFVDALGRGSSGVEFFRDSATNIAATAARAEIQQLILHGSVGAGESAKAYGDSGLAGWMKELMVAKTAGEQAVISSGIPYTIIRHSHLIRYGTKESGNAALYEDQMTTGSVTRQGLARLTADCILAAQCMSRIYHAADKSLEKN